MRNLLLTWDTGEQLQPNKAESRSKEGTKMAKKFQLFDSYVVIEIESLHDFQIFCSTRKIVEYEIKLFWQKYARGEKIEFAITIAEFKHFYLNEK